MPGDPYLSWEHLLDEELAAQGEGRGDDDHRTAHAPPAPELPPELQRLMAQRQRLERELQQLTGAAEPDAEQQRMERMFPVKVHTRETRIEERRLRQRDELLRMQQQRLMEQRRIAARWAQLRQQHEAQRRQHALEQQRLHDQWVRERHEALLQAARLRAQEAAWQARRDRLGVLRAEHGAATDEAAPRGAGDRPQAFGEVAEWQRDAARERARARTQEQRAFEQAHERQRCLALERAAQRRDALQDMQRERCHGAPRTRAPASDRPSPRRSRA